jgi:hypothetical protein
MRFADELLAHPLRLTTALGGYSKSLPRSGVIPTSLARVPGKPHKLPAGKFRICPRDLLCGVSLPRRATAGVGVDERVEGASGRPPWFILLDVDQVEQAAPIRPLVEPHGGVPSFDDLNQASDEVDGVRTVIALAVCSVNLHGGWLVHIFLLGAKVRLGWRGEAPAEPRGYQDPSTLMARDG